MGVEAVIFDYNRTLVEGETESPRLFPDTSAVLANLKERGIKMAIVSAGEDINQRQKEFDDLNLEAQGISVFKVIGREGRKDIQPILDELKAIGENSLVVGDRIKQEILEGNRVNAKTVWIQRGKFANELPETPDEEPDYVIQTLAQLIPIIASLDE